MTWPASAALGVGRCGSCVGRRCSSCCYQLTSGVGGASCCYPIEARRRAIIPSPRASLVRGRSGGGVIVGHSGRGVPTSAPDDDPCPICPANFAYDDATAGLSVAQPGAFLAVNGGRQALEALLAVIWTTAGWQQEDGPARVRRHRMVSEHRASFLASCAAPCGCKPRLARLAGPGNGVSVPGSRRRRAGVKSDRLGQVSLPILTL